MKHELKITKDNYREVVLKRGIITCWILLAICLVVKIFGGNFFNIVCNDENFIKFCNYCDTSLVKYIIYYICFMFECLMLALIIKPNTNIKDIKLVIYFIVSTIFWTIKVLVELSIIKISIPLFSGISLLILYLMLFYISNKPLKSLYLVIYETLLGIMSSLVKSVSLTGLMTNSFLITTIFLIDFYIALILTMLYKRKINLKKEKS